MNTRLFVIAITPGIALALSVYFTDRYDKEPLALLIKVFVLGAVSVIPTALVERFLLGFNVFSGVLSAAFTAFIVAGLTEEFFKRGVVLLTAFKNKAFDEKLDGIVYAIFAALGFATVENIVYVVFRFTTNPHIGIYRGIFSVPAHMLFAVTMGYYLSLAKFTKDEALRKKYLRKSWFVPAVLHGIFNFILMTQLSYAFLVFVPYVVYLWVVNLRKLNEYYVESKVLYKKDMRLQ